MTELLARRWRQPCLLLAVLLVLCVLLSASSTWSPDESRPGTAPRQPPSRQLLRSLNLTVAQCSAAFPNLTADIDRTVGLGPFALKQTTGKMGPLQARIRGGELFIVNWEPKGTLAPQLVDSRMASLHQIHRALVTSPEPLPDTIFSLNIQDQPFGTAFSYARPAYAAPSASGGPTLSRAFLMPHFSFWAWPLPFVGSFARAAAATDEIEARTSFAGKDPRAVWRGTARFNSVHNPKLRQRLLAVTDGAAWADVQQLTWDDNDDAAADPDGYGAATNALRAEDFCRYKYVIHTEGVTYSGRFQLHQLCRSVLLTPPIAWLQHTTHLVRPAFSRDLLGTSADPDSWTPSADVLKAWPRSFAADEANAVFVAPDWSDLEDTVRWLENHPQTAEGIATRQRDLFVGAGYLSPAAEACYWRALIRGWSRVAQVEWEDEGVPWELFSMGHEEWQLRKN